VTEKLNKLSLNRSPCYFLYCLTSSKFVVSATWIYHCSHVFTWTILNCHYWAPLKMDFTYIICTKLKII